MLDLAKEGSYEPVFDIYRDTFLGFGYFSLSAATFGDGPSFDLLGVKIYPYSASGNESAVDYSALNRDFIRNSKLGRRQLKARRREEMPLSFGQFGESESVDLNVKSGDLVTAIELIKEAENRARQQISMDGLCDFIASQIQATITAACRRIELASARFEETAIDVTEMWWSLRQELDSLAAEAVVEMLTMSAEVLDYVNLTMSQADPKRLKKELKRQATSLGDPVLTPMLIGFCVIEFVCYLVFFCVKHRATHGFKKLD
jgi:hypothetical protein